jgi:surface protein
MALQDQGIRSHHGNNFGFLQPDFICIIFGKMMVSKYQRSDADMCKAANAWCEDPEAATVKYGHISKWNTSLVTNMKEPFYEKNDFNDDISKWDVSNVTDMGYMFWNTPFNGNISEWNVSSVTNMSGMFCYSQFNGGISLDGISAMSLTWEPCSSLRFPLMGISLDGM